MRFPPSLPALLVFAVSLVSLCAAPGPTPPAAAQLPEPNAVLEKMRQANASFVTKWPNPGAPIVTDKTRPSNMWTRAVYFEGLMALYAIDRDPTKLAYAVGWGEAHHWGLRRGSRTRSADDQCCGQTYLELYQLDRRPERLNTIRQNLDFIASLPRHEDWTWIDALQMAMPVYAKLGVITKKPKYFETMHALYLHAKTRQGGHGLYNPDDHLWWRDKDFVAPYKEPNAEDCYWSRGNGWVVAALVRVLDVLPADAPHREEYETTLKDMCGALKKVQREDGFWNCSLHDPDHFGGRETSGTALFVFGMAWGVRTGLLPREEYLPVIAKAWNGIATEALRPDGAIGYVQGTGKEPKDGQPVALDRLPDFEDFGLGCVLLAGSEVYRLSEALSAGR